MTSRGGLRFGAQRASPSGPTVSRDLLHKGESVTPGVGCYTVQGGELTVMLRAKTNHY